MRLRAAHRSDSFASEAKRSGPGGDLDDCAGLSTLQSDLIDWLDGQKLFDVHVHGRNQNNKYKKIKNKPDRPTLVRMSEVTRNNELILGGLMETVRYHHEVKDRVCACR